MAPRLLGTKGKDDASTCRYFKRKLIGTGSYGEAWLVERVEDGVILVVKVMNLGSMSARDKQYAYSEIKCLASCDHPSIVKYVEDAEEDGNLLIVMEFADSGDLDRQVKARATDNFSYFQEHEVLFLFLQICLSLDHVHTHKMLHRDIKGANILLTSNGLIKLGDFGFSHQYEGTVSGACASTFCGTPYYLAPELWNNQRYSKKADVWSLGVLLYEIIALKRPFNATNMKGLMAKVNKGEFPPLPDRYSQELRDVVRNILVVDANKRPTIAQVFEMPYVRQGLKVLMSTIHKNGRIAADVKEGFQKHIEEVINRPSSGANAAPVGVINKEVSHSGAVRKMGGVNGKAWKDRWLMLQRGHLIICDKEGDEQNSGKALSLEQVHSVCPVVENTAGRESVFAVNTTSGKSMWLQGQSRGDMEVWVGAIQNALGI